MSKKPTLEEHTKTVFQETVNVYRRDFHAMLKNPWPFLMAIAALFLFAFLVMGL